MTPLERAIRASCDAEIAKAAGCGYPGCGCYTTVEAMAEKIVAAALADDEATIEAMARAHSPWDWAKVDAKAGSTWAMGQRMMLLKQMRAARAAARRHILGDCDTMPPQSEGEKP